MRSSLLILVLAVTGCATAPGGRWAAYNGVPSSHETAAVQGASPCSDSLYVALRARPMESLSAREYDYFTAHDRACMEYQQTAQGEKTIVEHHGTNAAVIVLATLGALVVIGLVL